MRKIIASAFVSLDGVMQAPGGPTEDPTNNFKYGGWMFNYTEEQVNQFIGQLLLQQPYDLLLGRRTYQIFAGYWPFRDDNPIGKKFNNAHKYVVSAHQPELTWSQSTLVTGDVVSQLKTLKQQEGPNLVVQGSSNLMQTLLKNSLIDELHILTFPVVLGSGKKLFEDNLPAGYWKPTYTQAGPKGTIIASYVPGGDIQPGSFANEEVSDLEKKRRLAMEKGEW